MTVDDVIGRESALMAKDLGFCGETYDFYTTVNHSLYEAKRNMNPKPQNFNDKSWHNRISAPTKNQIRGWLIENYDIYISSSNPTKFTINEDSIFELNLLTELKKLWYDRKYNG